MHRWVQGVTRGWEGGRTGAVQPESRRGSSRPRGGRWCYTCSRNDTATRVTCEHREVYALVARRGERGGRRAGGVESGGGREETGWGGGRERSKAGRETEGGERNGKGEIWRSTYHRRAKAVRASQQCAPPLMSACLAQSIKQEQVTGHA